MEVYKQLILRRNNDANFFLSFSISTLSPKKTSLLCTSRIHTKLALASTISARFYKAHKKHHKNAFFKMFFLNFNDVYYHFKYYSAPYKIFF